MWVIVALSFENWCELHAWLASYQELCPYFDDFFGFLKILWHQKVLFQTRSRKNLKYIKLKPFCFYLAKTTKLYFLVKIYESFCKIRQTNFPEFYWTTGKIKASTKYVDFSKAMGISFESFYTVLLVCQASSLWDL